jgi:hypothetical protein
MKPIPRDRQSFGHKPLQFGVITEKDEEAKPKLNHLSKNDSLIFHEGFNIDY